MPTTQDDIGRGIAAVAATWTTEIGAAAFEATWDKVGRGGNLGKAMVRPLDVETTETVTASSRVVSQRFLLDILCPKRDGVNGVLTSLLRYARAAFQPNSRTLQTAVAALTGLSGKILGVTLSPSIESTEITDAAQEAAEGNDPRQLILRITIAVRFCESLS
jgi:hypothetical protein